jgi:polysaccharide pyruvyl transferase WcaK-like protein
MLEDAKIALLTPSGWGNLGDTAILESLIGGIRRRLARARIIAFTLNAVGTTRDHAIEAHTLLGYSPTLYTMVEAQPAQRPGFLLRAWWRMPGHGTLERIAAPPLDLLREIAHLWRSRRLLRGASAVVVAGGGQLDDFFGGALGQPWALLRYGLLAREIGAKFFFASVGTGALSPLSRALALRALRLADHRSFRDEQSRRLLRAPEVVGDDPIIADLAYGFPVTPVPLAHCEELTVGISPMAFGDPRQWPEKNPARYQRHIASFASLAKAQLARGNKVILFSTGGDLAALEDTMANLEPEDRARVHLERTRTLSSLFEVLAKTDVVVAARLHGVLLAHLAHRPVLAVAHERKVRSLMEQMGQLRFCIDIEQVEEERASQLLDRLVAERFELSKEIGQQVEQRRAQVEAQYDELFAPDR